MLPLDREYLYREYVANKRSIGSIATEWKMSKATIHRFMKNNSIETRKLAVSGSPRRKKPVKKHSDERRGKISDGLIKFNQDVPKDKAEKIRESRILENATRGTQWLTNFRKKGARHTNVEDRPGTKIAQFIASKLPHLFPVLDKESVDIVVNGDTAIIIDGYFRVKNYAKDGWLQKRKDKINSYGFKRVIYCKYLRNFSVSSALVLLNLLVSHLNDNEPEVNL